MKSMKMFRHHELLYLPKVDLSGRGHCNFTANEVLTAFGLAVRQP